MTLTVTNRVLPSAQCRLIRKPPWTIKREREALVVCDAPSAAGEDACGSHGSRATVRPQTWRWRRWCLVHCRPASRSCVGKVCLRMPARRAEQAGQGGGRAGRFVQAH